MRWIASCLCLSLACAFDLQDLPGGYVYSARPLTRSMQKLRPPKSVLLRPPAEKDLEHLARAAQTRHIKRFVDEDLISAMPAVTAVVNELLDHYKAPFPTGFAGGDYDPANPKLAPLTLRKDMYNLFYIDDPGIATTFWVVKRAFHAYAEYHKLDLNQPWWIHGWANCFGEGGKGIRNHSHGTRVSGNVAVHTAPGSYTIYQERNPADWNFWAAGRAQSTSSVKDLRHMSAVGAPDAIDPDDVEYFIETLENGDLTLFNGMVNHKSNDLDENHMKWYTEQAVDGVPACRVSIAFDIVPTVSYHHGRVMAGPPVNFHNIPIYDPDDPWFEKDPSGTIGQTHDDALRKAFEVMKVPKLFDSPGRAPEGLKTTSEWLGHLYGIYKMVRGGFNFDHTGWPFYSQYLQALGVPDAVPVMWRHMYKVGVDVYWSHPESGDLTLVVPNDKVLADGVIQTNSYPGHKFKLLRGKSVVQEVTVSDPLNFPPEVQDFTFLKVVAKEGEL